MDKRYQIFISSTFRDLIEERQAVLKAILEIDHMPAGMELFPASDETAWRLIQDVILSSDYYVVIVGGRYGSTDEAGVGYTEREYEFALQQKVPVIALLHASPDNLPRDRTETEEAAWAKLQMFRARIEKRHTCVYWSGVDDLKAKVIVGLTAATKRFPRVGWIRSDRIPTEATVTEILSLRTRVAELESELQEAALSPPKGTENLLQGDDEFEVKLEFVARTKTHVYPNFEDKKYAYTLALSWDTLFGAIAPKLIDEESDADIRGAFRRFFETTARDLLRKDKELKGKELREFKVQETDIDTCVVQLRALGLIRESIRKRSVKDTDTYWTLTPYGDARMVQLRALRRPSEHETRTVEAAPAADQAPLLANAPPAADTRKPHG